MARRYQLHRRAERQEDTRRRIVEAAVTLHGSLGLAGTTVTQIADLAGVGRQTVYRHFPDERSLVQACSGLFWLRNPLPDPERWRAIAAPDKRLDGALRETYAYHRRTEAMLAPMLAEMSGHAVLQPYHDHWRRGAEAVSSAWHARGHHRRILRAAVGHALVFQTWHSLVRDQGLTDRQAVGLMRRLVSACAAGS